METSHGVQTTAPAWCCPALSLALAPGLQHPGLSALLELMARLPRLVISPKPHSGLLSEQCFFLQQWLQLAFFCDAEGPLNQGRSHGKAASEPGVSAARDLHTNLATGENPAQAVEGEKESHPFHLMSFPKL